MSKFSPGDTVVCVDDKPRFGGKWGPNPELKFGNLYIVDSVPGLDGGWVFIGGICYASGRFRHHLPPQERAHHKSPSLLPSESDERKKIPIYSGLIRYFPLALARVAELSLVSNEKHNPGEPLHWNRDKSGDELDALCRHLIDEDWVNVAWRALANLQKQEENRLGLSVTKEIVE